MNTAQLSDLLYAVGMESQEAWQHMPELCEACGVPYPPQPITQPIQGEPAPVTLAIF